jgi:hypothetical protein
MAGNSDVVERRVKVLATLGQHAARSDVKVMQELMRHADPGISMKLYAQAISADKRRAQTRIVKMVAGTAKNEEVSAVLLFFLRSRMGLWLTH